ncbi:MAG TPA: helix-turn-helix domain-containing protein [Armatimonadota bacterium]|nr:helix-turn-helix domain-containing protein [Armatimonadota bacterium]
MAIELPDVLTIDEVAGYLRISKSSAYRLARQGDMPGQRVGGSWRFSRVAVEEWLRSSGGSESEGSPAAGDATGTDGRTGRGR